MTSRPWLRHYDPGVPPSLKPYPDKTLLDCLSEAARTRGDAPILHFKGTRVSYSHLASRSDAFAAGLHSLGVRRGDRVALALPNCPQFLVAEFGAWKAGAVVCPLNPTYTPREMEDALAATGADTVVVLNRFYRQVKAAQPKTAVKRVLTTNIKEYLPPVLRLAFTLLREKKEGDRITLAPGDVRMADVLAAHRRARAPALTVGPDDPAVILMSGGTTGTPKGVVGTQRCMMTDGLQLRSWLRSVTAPGDVIMLPLPLFHTYGNTGLQSIAFINDNPIALIANPRDLDGLLQEIERVRPGFMCAVPTLLTGIMNHPRVSAGKVDFRSIKLTFSGAAPLLAETKRRWEELTGGVILEGYSLTEAQMAVVANPALGPKKVGSVGMPLPDVDVAIVDPDSGTTEMPRGDVGEIVLSAPQLMNGYWQRPDETREMLRSGAGGERRLFTGDLGYIDEDGYLFIVDRKKDLIKTSGYQVWPREIEEVIATHPAVAEVGVAGITHPVKGEIVKAWVVTRPGLTVTTEELRAFCRERLAPYKVPASFDFPSELPKSMVGKVLRRVLRTGAEQQAAALN